MAKKYFLKIVNLILSSPILLLSWIAYSFSVWSIREETEKCINIIDRKNVFLIPEIFFDVLIAAEDRRNLLHNGVDPISIMRAFFINCTGKGFQGASTIEQQFVRVVSGRYERSIFRKIREQLLAVSVVRFRTKREIAKAYILIAHYGCQTNQIHNMLQMNFNNYNTSNAVEIVSMLKYPIPEIKSFTWYRKHRARCNYIISLLDVKANGVGENKYKSSLVIRDNSPVV